MSQTKVQLIKDGALAEDSIVHDGDTNTKIRFSGADTITAETGGSERVKVDAFLEGIKQFELPRDRSYFK